MNARTLRPRSFRAQLACCFALLGALLALFLAVALGAALAQRSREDASVALDTVASNAARLLADGLGQRLREVQTLAASATLWSEGLASARVVEALGRSQRLDPHSAWIGVADAGGVVRTATGGLLVGMDITERPWFEAGLRGHYVGDVHPARLLAGLLPPARDGAPLRFVDFAAPIHHDGRVLGVVALHGSWEWTRATIESLLPAPAMRLGLEVFVFDRDGTMIYAPGTTLARQQQLGQRLPEPPSAGTEADAEAHVVAWRDGVSGLTAAAALPPRGGASDLGWTVVARQPVAVAHAAARRGAALALAMALAAAALSAALGWWLASRLTRSLRLMAGDAQRVEFGPLPSALPSRRGSVEVEQLSGALNGMVRRLLQANADLEERVQNRTAALERANAALQRLAHHDPLTGLLNRRGLDDRLAVALAAARRRQMPLSLLTLDADHFKQVNDRHGHEVGDQVLQAIAGVLRRRLREVDIIARVGGEEFVVVLTDTGGLGAAHVGAALVNSVQMTPMPEVGSITVSCGAAELRVGAEEPEAALRRADAALYRAKHSGRNRCCVDGEVQADPVADAAANPPSNVGVRRLALV